METTMIDRMETWLAPGLLDAMDGVPADSHMLRFYSHVAKLDRIGMSLLRAGLGLVLVWIGALKFARYEADSIVPLVVNSPVMSFFYHHPAPEYRPYMNREGELIPAHRQWHQSNGTYAFAYGLGVVIILIGVLIALHPVLPQAAALGSFLLILMACTTLSFLVTTPEAWVPDLGDTPHGFPFLLEPAGWWSGTPSCLARQW